MRRRILAVLIVVLLLALLVPRACQALFGSKEDTGSGEERRAGAPETGAGAGGGTETGTGKAGTKDASSDRGAPFIKNEAGSEGTSGAATDLTATIVGPAVIGGDEASAVEDAAGSSSADQTTQSPAGPSLVARPQASQQSAAEPQNAPETSRAPAERPPSDIERAPANRRGPSGTVEPLAATLGERVRNRRDRITTAPVAVEPVPAAPSAVASDTAFVAGGTGGMATNFGGNAVGGTVKSAAAFNGAARGTPAVTGAASTAPVTLAGGARRTVTGPIRTPRSATPSFEVERLPAMSFGAIQ